METKNDEISNVEKKGRWRFIVTSAIAVILVCAASAGIVLAYQMLAAATDRRTKFSGRSRTARAGRTDSSERELARL